MNWKNASNLVMSGDRMSQKLLVYDLDLLKDGDPLEQGEVWSVMPRGGHGPADMKYRENTVFGDVILLTGWSFAQIISYPEGKSLWYTENTANNPHSVESLPAGNLVVACSTGGCLRLYHTSALLTGDTEAAQKCEDYLLPDAHGLLYDPKHRLLWALGLSELEAYRIKGTGVDERLVKDPEFSTPLPEGAGCGHDLSADFTDPDFVYLSANAGVYRFCKTARTFNREYPLHSVLNRGYMKGVSNNPNGTFFFSYSNGGKGTPWEGERFASWSTDRLHSCRLTDDGGIEVKEHISGRGAAFYKCRAFCGQYQ